MLYNCYLQRRVRRQMLLRYGSPLRSRISHGFHTRPIFTLTLLTVAAICLLTAVLVVAALALAAACVTLLGVAGYRIGRRLLWASRAPKPRLSGSAALSENSILHQYLYAVEEFNELVDLTLAEPLEQIARTRRVQELSGAARRLQRHAVAFAADWRGSDEAAACISDLRQGTEALAAYISALQRSGSRRPSLAELRQQRIVLSECRDRLVQRLRATDFRSTSAAPVSV